MKFKDWIINGFPNSMLWFIVVTFVLYVMNLNIIAVLLSLTFFVFSIFYFIYNLPFQNKKKSIVIFLNLLFSAFFAFFVVLFEFADPEGIIVPIWLFASLFYILININVLTKRIEGLKIIF